jgi:hypothetical protein
MGASALAAFAAISATPAAATTIIDQDFSTDPICTTGANYDSEAGGCSFYGAQHGVNGTSVVKWADFTGGSGGSTGYAGYTPQTRAGVSFITYLPNPLTYAQLLTFSIDVNNGSASSGDTVSGDQTVVLHEQGVGWFFATDPRTTIADGTWKTLTFDLQSELFQASNADASDGGRLPYQATGSVQSLSSGVIIDEIGLATDTSGVPPSGSSYTLKFDNFIVTANVPEPASIAVFAAGLIGVTFARRRKA